VWLSITPRTKAGSAGDARVAFVSATAIVFVGCAMGAVTCSDQGRRRWAKGLPAMNKT